MRVVLGAVLVLVAARDARGECVYHNGYYDPGVSGACGVETMVPQGCPLHVATPTGTPASFAVFRDAQELTLEATDTVVDALGVPMDRIDPIDCECTRVPGITSFDRHAITLTGARAGDVVAFEQGHLDLPTQISIGPAGPCPAATWPTEFSILTQCDRCPVDDAGPLPGDDDGVAGCTTGGGVGLLAGLAVVGLVVRRRVSRPDAA
ncbi:MAG TPA: hypothetical protein VFQ53_36485 [Kofleriaceae bacterium]|nr:hypothetical protein [Kofleriaceae bacterium]